MAWRLRRCANIRRRSEAKHCSSLCSQSEGERILWRPNTAKNPTKICPKALAIFATCSWPSLCEQSELQCWRRNRRLCGSVKFSATRVLPLTFDISILNALPFRGAVASLPILIFLDFEHPTCPQKTQVVNPVSQLVGERRPRFIRFISQTRSSLVPDANAPPPRAGPTHYSMASI